MKYKDRIKRDLVEREQARWVGPNRGFKQEHNKIVFGQLFDIVTEFGEIEEINGLKLDFLDVCYVFYKRENEFRVIGQTRMGAIGKEHTIDYKVIENILVASNYVLRERGE